MRSYLKEKVAAPVYKTEINDREYPHRSIRKFGTKFRQQVAGAQSV
jgi:hypothetical protein